MPMIGDFHAENTCSQRVYEYLFPMGTLLHDIDSNDTAMASLMGYLSTRGIVPPADSTSFVDDGFFTANDAKLEGQTSGRRVGDWDTKRPRNKMDEIFQSSKETDSAQKRIHFFRNLKVLFKKFGGKHGYHNFAAGGACPEDSVTLRRVDRVYHKEVVELDQLSPDDLDVEVGMKRVFTDTLPMRDEGDYTNLWAVFSLSGNSFLRGQVSSRIIGLYEVSSANLYRE